TGAGLGALSGAVNPVGEFISAGGAILGGIIDVSTGGSFFGEGFQAGGLIGGLAGGGYAAGKAAFGKVGGKAAGWAAARAGFSAGMKTFGVEGTSAAIGFGYGMYSTGGDFQTSLMYANWGQMAPNATKALARGGAGLYRWGKVRSGAEAGLSGLVKSKSSVDFSGAGRYRNPQAWIDSVIDEDIANVSLSHRPRYNGRLKDFGQATLDTPGLPGSGRTTIGRPSLRSRTEMVDTIIHEETHHRLWERFLRGSKKAESLIADIDIEETYVDAVAKRFLRMKGLIRD
ncbi:MAG TPA: hypothetical protein VMY37_25575, partial [Thermoguttaceae bacterium]|nr:hypothetical protein [Thermoguttaceae bacterium]